jgi:hypothetical protein
MTDRTSEADRRKQGDRRAGKDRRKADGPSGSDHGNRRGVDRRQEDRRESQP